MSLSTIQRTIVAFLFLVASLRAELDVTTCGVPTDGKSDCLPALQAITAQLQPTGQALLHFPAGRYTLSGTLDLSAIPFVRLRGDGCVGTNRGTVLCGNFAGDLIKQIAPGPSLRFIADDVAFVNPGGTALHLEGQLMPSLIRCNLAGQIGLDTPAQCFDPVIDGCRFLAPKGGQIGLRLCGLTNARVSSCYWAGWQEGARLSGTALTMESCRFETNAIGLRLGLNSDGSKWTLGRAVFAGLSMEANDVAVDLVSARSCTIQGVTILGTTNAPSKQSKLGIDDHGSSNGTFKSIDIAGGFTQAAVNVRQPGIAHWMLCEAKNNLPNLPAWLIDPKARPNTRFADCNQN